MSLKHENQTLLLQLQKYSPSPDSKSSAALVWGSLAPRRAPRGRRAKRGAKASKVALAQSSPAPPKARLGPAPAPPTREAWLQNRLWEGQQRHRLEEGGAGNAFVLPDLRAQLAAASSCSVSVGTGS